MAMPLFLATVLMLAYNLVDSIWVGNLLGENGYAALTTAGSVSLHLYERAPWPRRNVALFPDKPYFGSTGNIRKITLDELLP